MLHSTQQYTIHSSQVLKSMLNLHHSIARMYQSAVNILIFVTNSANVMRSRYVK